MISCGEVEVFCNNMACPTSQQNNPSFYLNYGMHGSRTGLFLLLAGNRNQISRSSIPYLGIKTTKLFQLHVCSEKERKAESHFPGLRLPPGHEGDIHSWNVTQRRLLVIYDVSEHIRLIFKE
jgi:hypothetical protein